MRKLTKPVKDLVRRKDPPGDGYAYLLSVLSVKLRKVSSPYFFVEPAARMRRTEVRPICNRRAISALLTPLRNNFRI